MNRSLPFLMGCVSGLALAIIIGTIGVFALVVRSMQTNNDPTQMSTGSEVNSGPTQISTRSEVAACLSLVNESKQALLEAVSEKHLQLWRNFDSMEIADYRRENKVLRNEVEIEFARRATILKDSIAKFDQSAKLSKNPKVRAYLLATSKGYSMALEVNQDLEEILRMTFDEWITSKKEVHAKMEILMEQMKKQKIQEEPLVAAAKALETELQNQ